jgi:hypothetical protein
MVREKLAREKIGIFNPTEHVAGIFGSARGISNLTFSRTQAARVNAAEADSFSNMFRCSFGAKKFRCRNQGSSYFITFKVGHFGLGDLASHYQESDSENLLRWWA